jgi:ketosteroid isomerase-like protein
MSKRTTRPRTTLRRSKPKWDPGLVKAHKGYVDAINSNDTDRVMAMYDKGIAVMQPDGPLVTGRRNVRKWVADYFETTRTHWVKKSKMMWVDGDFGFDQGVDTAADRPRAGGPIQRYTVKGILIYKRQKNGEWLVFRDIWNYNSPATLTRS